MLADAVDAGTDDGSEVPQEDWSAPPYRLGPGNRRTAGHHAAVRRAGGGGRRVRTQLPRALTVTVPLGDSLRSCARATRFMPSLGMAAALVGRRLSCGGSRSRRSRDPDSRSSRPARSRAGHRRRRSVEAARPADDAHQLPRAGASRRAGDRIRSTKRRCCCIVRRPAARRREAGRQSATSSRTRSFSSA